MAERDSAASPRPWRQCGHNRGGCSCGSIWSIPADAPVATVTVGKWGDHFAEIGEGGLRIGLFEYGEVPEPIGKANAALIVRAVNLHDVFAAALRQIANDSGFGARARMRAVARAALALAEGRQP
jgi:hypothetical protein